VNVTAAPRLPGVRLHRVDVLGGTDSGPPWDQPLIGEVDAVDLILVGSVGSRSLSSFLVNCRSAVRVEEAAA